jgi:hypothetical protein
MGFFGLKKMLDSAEYLLTIASETLKEIEGPEEGLVSSIIQLNSTILDMMGVLNEQRSYLRGYLKTCR